MEEKLISKEEFLAVVNNNIPSKIFKWVYENFSTNLTKKPIPILSWVCLLSFFVATIGMITFDQLHNKEVATKFAYLYLVFFTWSITLPLSQINNYRIKKICKKLNISVYEYNKLINLYM